ncbi:lipopolysaccharide biosynthesis protein [Rathayibacter sp. SD072]|uniref:lipopolysaccharide biosynthesis protein n=1 Tax=Rathayibacter sp. SD072 TaxID=2781731 RepID=UPI001A966580|nr:lipopolysaccharide biosynthesis protein [Rathayibacter sp. SD072]MBO0982879.1 lipopolysaccharide biosynthesis protein [Rathayibacter sp. SD072]
MSVGRTAARGAKVTLIGQWSKFVLQTGSTVVLARLLAPDDYGLFAMIVALAGLATLLGDFGLSTASIQAKEITQHQRSNLLWLNILVGLVIATAFFFAAPAIANFYGRPELADIARVLSANFILQSVTTQFVANASRNLRFKLLAIADVVAQALAFAAAVAIAVLGGGVWALVFQQLTISAVLLAVVVSTSRWLPSLPHRAPMRPLLTFGLNTFGVQAINYVSANVDTVLLGRFWGPQALGFYTTAYQLFRLPVQQIAAPMSRVALPVLSRSQDDLPAMNRYLQRAQTFIVYVLGAAFFLAAALAPPLVELVLGPQWGLSATLFAILAIGGLFQSMGYVYYWAFVSLGLTGLQLRYSLITRTFMVLLIVAGVAFGSVGVAVAVALGLFLNWLVLSIFPMRKTGLDVGALMRRAALPMLVHVTVFAAVFSERWFLTAGLISPAQLAIGVMTGIACYAIWFLLCKPVRRGVLETVAVVRKAL